MSPSTRGPSNPNASKDRLGRNPFDRASYSAGGASGQSGTSGPKKASAKRRSRKTKAAPPTWQVVLEGLGKLAPLSIQKFKICEKIKTAVSFCEAARASWQRT